MTSRIILAAAILLTPGLAVAAGAAPAHHDPVAPFLIALLVVLLAAKLGGELFERIGQPAVLGELIAGVVIGNLDYLFGLDLFTGLRSDSFIDIFARIGVVVLLFEVGLETDLGDMMKVGASSLLVAVLGVAAPMVLGFAVGVALLPEASWSAHAFLGATLAATSVGITARVLKDMGKLQARESRIILGAAVIDDVIGLTLLAVVSGLVTTGSVTALGIAKIVGISVLFLAGSVLVGGRLATLVASRAARMRVRGMKLIAALSFCFAMAWLADVVGLAPIVGAFAAGLVLKEGMFQGGSEKRPLNELLEPLTAVFVPIFFVLMGLQVRLETFGDLRILGLGAAITVVAIAGKQICSLGVLERGLDRLSIGVGMVPRGEVGLIFASIGRSLGVLDDALFTALVLMVIVTTFVTPPALRLTMALHSKKRARAS